MNAQRKDASDQYTRYSIKKDDRVLYKGRYYSYHGEFPNGVLLKPVDEGAPEQFEPFHWHEVAKYIGARVLEVEKGYFGVENAIKRIHQTKIFDLPPDVILRARMCAEFLAAAEDVYDTGEIYTRSDDSIRKFLAKFEAENAAMVAEARGGKKERRYRDKTLVGPRQFRRLLKTFEENHFEPASLLPRYQGRATAGRFDQSIKYIMEFARKYQSTDRPTMKACYEKMVWDNNERGKRGEQTHELPSLRTFQRVIKELGDYESELGRTTNKLRVVRKYVFSKKGLRVTRPLQVVEMDEHEMDLVVLLTKNGIWDYLHADIRKRVSERRRAWISVALDVYSRSICGMRLLYDAPDGNSAVSTLAMVARVKNAETALNGTRSPWPQGGTPEAIHTDAGAGYVSAAFQAAAMALTKRHVIPPSKHPHLRGHVERFFGTLNQRYTHFFSGQTFSNVLLKDEYDSDKHAHITHDELSHLLVCLIVDCYHNTVQRGLYGLTPLQAWYRGSQLEGEVQAHPSADDYRDIFAITDKRRLCNTGIEILGNRYSSEELQILRKHWYNAELTVRINEQDISNISVKHRYTNDWITVPAVFDGLKNVTLFEWMETVRYINKHFAARAAHSQKLVRETIARVQEVSDVSREARGVGSPLLDASVIHRFEKREMATFRYSQPQNFDFGDEDESAGSPMDYGEGDVFGPPEGVYEAIRPADDERRGPQNRKGDRKRKARSSDPHLNGGSNQANENGDALDRSAAKDEDEQPITLHTSSLRFRERKIDK